MGRINNVLMAYLEDNERFADLFNGCCFNGERVIEADKLTEGSGLYLERSIQVRNMGKAKVKKYGEKKRDLKKYLISGMTLRVLGLENQEHVDYTMPWRIMGYDYHEYGKQLQVIKKKNHSVNPSLKDAEYLCGFRREDRLSPCYTICLYHGEEPWDGPKHLQDMMRFGEGEDKWKFLFSDYRMNLVCLNEWKDYSCFHSSLREVFGILPYRKDKKGLKEYLENHPVYQALDEETAEVASELMGLKTFMVNKKKYEEGGNYNVCTALREMMEDCRSEGEARFQALTRELLQKGRIADLEKAAADDKYKEKLYLELGISGK